MNKLTKKTLSLLLGGSMAFSSMAGFAFAAENDFAISTVGGTLDSKIESITTQNTAAGESAGVGVVAVYQAGILKGLTVTDSNAVVTAGTYPLKTPIAYNPATDTYKAFVWNSLDGQKPLTEVYSPGYLPTPVPTATTTTKPTATPTVTPTPTRRPTEPTVEPTAEPTVVPTVEPTVEPTPVPKYAITVASVENGTVTVSPETEAEAGVEITVTAKALAGYVLQSLTYTPAGGEATPVVEGKFIMPDKAVTITAVFAADPEAKTVKAATAWMQGKYGAAYTRADRIIIDGRTSATSAAAMAFTLPEGFANHEIKSATLQYTTDTTAYSDKGYAYKMDAWTSEKNGENAYTGPVITYTNAVEENLIGTSADGVQAGAIGEIDVTQYLNALAKTETSAYIRLDAKSGTGKDWFIYDQTDEKTAPKLILTLGEELRKVTFTVKVAETPTAGVKVTINGKEYISGENGQILLDLKAGTYSYSVAAGTYEEIAPTEFVVGDADYTADITLTKAKLVLDHVVISGGVGSTLATGVEKTLPAFTAKAFTSGDVEIEEATIGWTIENGGSNTAQMTIDPVTGVVTVPETAAVDDTATVTATAEYDTVSKTATAVITVKEALQDRLPQDADIDTMTTIATNQSEVGNRTVVSPESGGKINLATGFQAKKDKVSLDFDFLVKDDETLNVFIGKAKSTAFESQGPTIEFKGADGVITITHSFGSNANQKNQPFSFDPNGTLATNTWYRAVINTNITGSGDESKIGSLGVSVYAVNEDGSIGDLVLTGTTTNLRSMGNATTLDRMQFDTVGTPYIDNAYVYKEKAYDAVVTVTDGENPLEGVTVTADDSYQTTAATDAEGKAALKLVPGSYSISLKKNGYEAEPVALTVTKDGANTISAAMTVILADPATLKLIYTTDGTVDTKVAEKEVDFGEIKYVGDEVTIPTQYVGILKVNDDVDTNMYTVYNFVYGPQDNKVTLSAAENTAIVTCAKDKKYYTYEDFEYGTLDGFVSADMKYLTEGAAGQGMIYKLRTGATWQATNWTTSEAQPITAQKTEMTFDMHYGYFGGGDSKNSKFALNTSAGEEILSVNYNATKSAITSIKIGGVEKLEADLAGYKDGNGYKDANNKAKIDIVVDYETNTATINLKRDTADNTFTGDISSLTTKDVAKWVHTNGINNDDRCSTVDNFKVFVPEAAPVE